MVALDAQSTDLSSITLHPQTHNWLKGNVKILIISQDLDLPEVIEMGLKLTTHWTIITAASPLQGIDLAKRDRPSAILLNVEVKDVARSRWIKLIKAHPATDNLPLILLCDRPRCCDRSIFTQMGVTGIITKPFDALTLAQQIVSF